MAKLIETPHRCGYRIPVHGYSRCHHIERSQQPCLDPYIFPEDCPLVDGYKQSLTMLEFVEFMKKNLKKHNHE